MVSTNNERILLKTVVITRKHYSDGKTETFRETQYGESNPEFLKKAAKLAEKQARLKNE